jgi:hypothetical protein
MSQKNNIQKRRLETKLLNALEILSKRGSTLYLFMGKNAKSNQYKIAKKRYLATLKEIDDITKELKSNIDKCEKDLIKNQTRERLTKAQEEVFKEDIKNEIR